MCRLMMCDRKGLETVERKIGAKEMMDFLEKSCGGHGNGFVLIKDGEVVYFDKGVLLSNKDIVEVTKSFDFDWIIYHTRVTSKGNTCDSQCHPFVSPSKDFVLAMNGTEKEYGEIGELLGTSDTDAIFRIYHAFGIEPSTLTNLSSRFLGFKKEEGEKGRVFLVNSTYFPLCLAKTSEQEGIIIASEFPEDIDCYEIESKYYWEEGMGKIKTSKVKRTVYRNPRYGSYGYGYYDGDWQDYYSYKDKKENKTTNIDKKKQEVKKTKKLKAIYECTNCGETYKNFNNGICPRCKNALEKELIDELEYEIIESCLL